jgi:DnaJ-class molecular chaperone
MKCKYCDGRGYYETLIETLADCPRCNGRGNVDPINDALNVCCTTKTDDCFRFCRQLRRELALCNGHSHPRSTTIALMKVEVEHGARLLTPVVAYWDVDELLPANWHYCCLLTDAPKEQR